MKSSQYVLGFFFLLMFASVNAHANVNWSGLYSPGDYTNQGVVTVTAATSLNPGTYTFDTLVINASQTLSILSDTANNSGVIINATTVTINGSIGGDGLGYAGNAGPGVGAATFGGCHGGYGGYGEDLVDMCFPYGSTLQPTTLGSGGGKKSTTTAGAGGSAVKLVVSGTLTVSGSISMNGTNAGASSGGQASGGGAGGSIWIDAGTLAGAGTIRANGGNGQSTYSGSGSGGHVAVYYGTKTFTGTMTANAGSSSAGYIGTFGSVVVVDSVNNDLYFNSSSIISNGTYSFRNITIASGAYISNEGLGSKGGLGTGKGLSSGSNGGGAGYGGRGAVGGSSTTNVNGGGVYGSALEPTDLGSGGGLPSGTYGSAGGGAIKFVASGNITIDGTLGSEGISGYGTGGYQPGGGSGGSIWLSAASVLGSGTVTVQGAAGYGSTGGGGGGGRIALYYSSSYSSSLVFNISNGSGGATTAGIGSLAIVDTANNNLYFPISSTFTSGTYSFNNVTVAAGAKVSVNDGNPADTGTGKGATGASGGGGGGYGGAGAAGAGPTAGGSTYGSAAAPVDLGSGGGNCGSRGYGGPGGGAIKFIITGTLTIGTGGNLNADGTNQILDRCGGGSGGSIWINVGNVSSVTGGITAKGGNGVASYGGGGGGGRIAIYFSGTLSGTVVVTGGTGNATGTGGSSTVTGPGPATSLFYNLQPSATAVQGVAFAQQPSVGAKDSIGNVLVAYSTAVTLTAFTDASCSTPATQTLNNGSSGSFTGYANFTGVNYTRMATIYLKATSGALTVCSSAIDVATNPATKLVFSTQPSGTAKPNVNFQQQPIVQGWDPNNLLDITFNGAITIVPYVDSSCTVMAGGNLSGTAVTTLGEAAYSGVQYDTTNMIYIKATSGALTSACSTMVNVINLTPWLFRGF